MQTHRVSRFSVSAYLCLLVLSSVGCQQSTTSKLAGRWEGRPDTAVLRAGREAKKYGDKISEPPDETDTAELGEAIQVTDWEAYDVVVEFDFVSSEQLKMSFNGAQSKTGKWKIIATSPTGCTIEVRTELAAETEIVADEKEEAEPQAELRRFDILLDERDEECVGFTLSEVGTDQQLGTLYFQRPKSSDTDQ